MQQLTASKEDVQWVRYELAEKTRASTLAEKRIAAFQQAHAASNSRAKDERREYGKRKRREVRELEHSLSLKTEELQQANSLEEHIINKRQAEKCNAAAALSALDADFQRQLDEDSTRHFNEIERKNPKIKGLEPQLSDASAEDEMAVSGPTERSNLRGGKERAGSSSPKIRAVDSKAHDR
ncbi:hypothetical protein VTL71DRAFT_15287 [Oculimacula yallundae]|uniref:Uncharacterized protein n=1 Tax=Oculimacula yallundae TaxID=86028 RepID=A0ABR4CG56_9HELO